MIFCECCTMARNYDEPCTCDRDHGDGLLSAVSEWRWDEYVTGEPFAWEPGYVRRCDGCEGDFEFREGETVWGAEFTDVP